MSYKLVYFEEARLDIQEAKAWYRRHQQGLELRFAAAIKAAIVRLQKRPTANAVRYKNVRVAHPHYFPYSIHYYIDEAVGYIVIIAIVHDARDPGLSRNRT